VTLDQLYRAHAPAITAALAKRFGAGRLELIGTAVQEAFVAALERWGDAPPEVPVAWLTTVARRRVVDALRAAAWFGPPLSDELVDEPSDAFGDEDLLAMMFVCCHPALPVESSVPLALRTLCGVSIPSLSRALKTDAAALEKRLHRARRVLRERGVAFERDGDVGAVLRTLYVLFFEGYVTGTDELCEDAVRLARLVPESPATHALLALMLLAGARMPARRDEHGDLLSLDRQDRTRWHRAQIDEAFVHLAAAARGTTITAYHLEATIAACHALASDYAATDWPRIVELYDRLLALAPSPVVALQRAIAIGRARGPHAGLRALAHVSGDERLDDDPVLAAAFGELKALVGDRPGARVAYQRALELAATDAERRFLEAKLTTLASASGKA
jgi:RNA polymerase sigma-70 factor (ECF subfamily)